jgi:putative pyruvate formate lyase activating enzyme
MRPDAVRVWQNQEIQSRFKRYFGIIKKEKVARYLLTKKISVSEYFDDSTPLEKLWSMHERTVGKFKTVLQEIDEQHAPITYLEKIDTPQTSFLDLKIALAGRVIRDCHFCERECHVDRFEKKGTCRLGPEAYVSSWFHHMGEEAPLIPSGTKN